MSTPEFNDSTTGSEVAAHFSERAKGLTVLITGANIKGIGGHTAVILAKAGAKHLILHGRSLERLQETVDAVRAASPSVRITTMPCDLADLSAVRQASQRILEDESIECIDVLFNNAGFNPLERKVTVDGLEESFAVSHIAHFVLTLTLMPKLLARGEARVVNMSSQAHMLWDMTFSDFNIEQKEWNTGVSYCQAKAANVYFTKGLVERFGARGLKSYSLHPGWVASEFARMYTREEVLQGGAMLRNMGFELGDLPLTLEEGCATGLVAVLDPDIQNGAYLESCQVHALRGAPGASTEDHAGELWKISERLTGLKVV